MTDKLETSSSAAIGVRAVLKSIPMELEIELDSISLTTRRNRWRIGDIAAQLCDQVRQHQLEASEMEVYQAISIELNHEISARTVRWYASLSEFYSQETRDKYDILPYSHFELAMNHRLIWQDILDAAIKRMEYTGGRPPSVQWLEAFFRGRILENQEADSDPSQPALDTIDEGNRLISSFDEPAEPEPGSEQPQHGQSQGERILAQQLSRIIAFLTTVVVNMPMSEAARVAITEAVRALSHASNDLKSD